MKFLALLFVAFAIANARRSHRYRRDEPNLRVQAQEVYNNAKENFPVDEFNAFWAKVQEKSALTKDELKAKFEANQGNMDLTLEEVFDKAQTQYPLLTQQWNRIKATWESKKDDIVSTRDDKLSDLYGKAKAMLEEKFGPIDYSTFQGKIGEYLAAININAPHRRYKREVQLNEVYAQAQDRFHQNFPKQEFKAFLDKLSEKAAITKDELRDKLESNKGDMDLTLEELSSKLQNNYPMLTQQYARIKNQWETAKDGMDETTLRDLYAKANAMFRSQFGDVDFDQFYSKIQNYVAQTYAGVTTRRYRREIPTEFRPHVDEFKHKIASRFPKTEWDQFYAKLEECMKDSGMDVKQTLDKYEGNMDLTLEELKEKMSDKYPELETKWRNIKQQMDNSIDKMDETTIKDLFMFVKKHAETALGRPITEETMKDFVGNMKSYISAFFSRMQERNFY